MLKYIFILCQLVCSALCINNIPIYAISDLMHNAEQLLPLSIYENDKIDGIYIQLLWSAIEPKENSYNWSTLDSQLNIINDANANRTSKLLISLSVRAGANSPNWIKSTVPSYNFTVSPHDSNMSCTNVTIPQPWNVIYINAYKSLISNLVNHLKDIDMYDQITIIKCGPINQNTEELRLPSADAQINTGSCILSNATDVWVHAGYHTHLIIKSWIDVAHHVHKLFPYSVMAIEILENNAFPPIDSEIDVTDKIINYGINNFDNFAVQWDGLNTVSTAPKVIHAGLKGAIVGWQSNLFFGPKNGAGCYGDSIQTSTICDKAGFFDLIDFGIRHMGQYIEVWPIDILNFFI